MKMVISALHFAWRDVGECLKHAVSELGADGVEFSWHPSLQRPHCTPADLDALASLRKHERPSLSAHIWMNPAQTGIDEGRKELLEWLALCGRTGADGIIMHGGSCEDRKEGIIRTRNMLEAVLSAYEKAGVTLHIENHYAYGYKGLNELCGEPWEFLELFSLDSPALKFCFDTGHGNMTKNSLDLLQSLKKWLSYVHLADNHGVDDDHQMFRRGTVDWDGVFKCLRAQGFDGTFCVEFPVRDDQAPFRDCVREIRRRWQAGQVG